MRPTSCDAGLSIRTIQTPTAPAREIGFAKSRPKPYPTRASPTNLEHIAQQRYVPPARPGPRGTPGLERTSSLRRNVEDAARNELALLDCANGDDNAAASRVSQA